MCPLNKISSMNHLTHQNFLYLLERRNFIFAHVKNKSFQIFYFTAELTKDHDCEVPQPALLSNSVHLNLADSESEIFTPTSM